MASLNESTTSARLPYDRQREIYVLALRNGSVDVSELAVAST